MMPMHKAITSGMSRLSAARDAVTVPAKSAIGTAYSNTIRFSVEASFDPKSCRRAATKPSKKVNTIGSSALKIVSSMLPACPCISSYIKALREVAPSKGTERPRQIAPVRSRAPNGTASRLGTNSANTPPSRSARMFTSKDARRVSHRGVHPRVMQGEEYIEPCIPKGDRAAHAQPRIREQRCYSAHLVFLLEELKP